MDLWYAASSPTIKDAALHLFQTEHMYAFMSSVSGTRFIGVQFRNMLFLSPKDIYTASNKLSADIFAINRMNFRALSSITERHTGINRMNYISLANTAM